MFNSTISITRGEIVLRDHFAFIDLVPLNTPAELDSVSTG